MVKLRKAPICSPTDPHSPELAPDIQGTSLYVEGVDHRPMPVAARTQLGPEGPIEVSYEGKPVEDNFPTYAFATGRQLLD